MRYNSNTCLLSQNRRLVIDFYHEIEQGGPCFCNRRAAETTPRPPVAPQTSTILSGYHATTCITMLDDASLGGKDATYS